MLHRPFILFLLLALLLADRPLRADVPIDSFEDGNFTAEGWGSAVWTGLDGGSNPIGRGNATRVNASGLLAISSKDAGLILGNGGNAFQFDDAVLGSDAPVVADRAQALNLFLARPSAYDATPHRYLRFTAWRTGAEPSGARFAVSFAENLLEPTYFGVPPVSVGPVVDPDGTGPLAPVVGVALDTAPQAFLVPLDQLVSGIYSPDVALATRLFVWNQGGQQGPAPTEAPGAADLSRVWNLAFGYYRTGSDASALMDASFALDDVAFLDALPGVSFDPAPAATQEGGAPVVVSVVLDALPVRDVVVSFASGDLSEGSVAPASLTFTPENWSVPQALTITPADDNLIDGEVACAITVSVASDDPLYDGIGVAPLAVTNADDTGDTIAVPDVVVDTFDDGNFTPETWGGGAWVTVDGGVDPTGLMTAWRVNANEIMAVSRKDASLVSAGGGLAFQGGPGAVLASDATAPPRRYQALSLVALRPGGFDAGSYRYLRFRAWDVAAPPAGATFVVALGENPLEPSYFGFPPVSFGPWSGTDPLTDLGLALTPEPRDYLVDLTTLAVDPLFDHVGRNTRQYNWEQGGSVGPRPNTFPGPANLGNVWSLGLGYQRRRDAAEATMGATFRIDDIAFLAAAPGVTATPDAVTTAEGGAPVAVAITLDALPMRPVTLLFTSSDPSEATPSPVSMTFTPENWTVPQSLTVVPVDDAVADGAVTCEIRARVASADGLYDGIAVAPVVVTNADDGDTTPLGDRVVDDFEDGDFTTQPWGGGAWIAFDGQAAPEGLATAGRTNPNGILATSRKDAALRPDGAGNAFEMGPDAILASDPADPTLRYQSLSLGALRSGSFDATGYGYLRFRAWRTQPAPTGARFTVALSQSPLNPAFFGMPPTSFGPWAVPGGDPATDLGLELGETPTDYLVPLAAFEADPLFERLGLNNRLLVWNTGGQVGPAPVAPGPAAPGDLWVAAFGYQRRGADAAELMSAGFVLDDVAFLRVAPGVAATAALAEVAEDAPTPATVVVALAARPSRDVVVSALVDDPAQGAVSGPLTFTPANWDVPQSFDVTAVDDADLDGSQSFAVSFAVASDDQLYDGATVAPVAFTALDDEALELVVTAAADPLRVPEEGQATFTVALNFAPPAGDVTVTPSIAGAASLALADATPFMLDGTNWNVPVTLTVTAARDANYADDAATVTLTAVGGLDAVATLSVLEEDLGSPSGVLAR